MPQPTTQPSQTAEYNPADHIKPGAQHTPLPGLAEALTRAAGQEPPTAPAKAVSEAKKPIVADDDKPAPHVKFTPLDDREPEPAKPAVEKQVELATEKTDTPKEGASESKGIAQLRDAYEKLKTDFTATVSERDLTKKEAAEFRAKAKTYEDRIKALEASEAKAKELEQKVLSYDERLRVTDYLNHPEFHERFVKPVADSIQNAHALVAEMVVDADGEPRQATPADFDMVLQAPNLTEATRRAKELFGSDLASAVIQQRQTVLAAERARKEAIKNAGLKSEEWLKAQEMGRAEQRSRAKSAFDTVANQLQEKYPQLYKAPDGDKDAVEARKAGEELARLILEGQPAEMAPDKYLENVAKIYHRAASFPMRELAVHRLEAENTALKAKLAAYEKSTPDAEGRKSSDGSTAAAASNDIGTSMRSSLEAYAKRGR